MLESFNKLLVIVFGDNKKKRFWRIFAVLAIVLITQCVSFGFDKKGDFYFNFTPFVKINADVKKEL